LKKLNDVLKKKESVELKRKKKRRSGEKKKHVYDHLTQHEF